MQSALHVKEKLRLTHMGTGHHTQKTHTDENG